MHIRWTFAFEEGCLSVDVRDEAEDNRIDDCVTANLEFLYVPTAGKEAYINLKRCKAIVREEISDESIATVPSQEIPSDDTKEG